MAKTKKRKGNGSVSVITKGNGGFTVRVTADRRSKLSPEELQAHLRVRKSASVTQNEKGKLKTRGEKHRRKDW